MKKRFDEKDIESIREKIFPSLSENAGEEESHGRRYSEKQDKRLIARQYRKTGKLVSLAADLSSDIEYMNGASTEIESLFSGAFSCLEKLKTGFAETERLSGDMLSPSENIRNAVSETSYSISDMHKSVSKFKRTLSDIANEFENMTDAESGAISTGELRGYITGLLENSSKIAAIADKIDIIGINSSLEAGKAGEGAAFFALMGSTLQKSVRAIEWKSREFNDDAGGFLNLLNSPAESEIKQPDINSEIKKKLNELSVNIGDISDILLALNGILEEVTIKIDSSVSENSKLHFSEVSAKKTDEIVDSIANASDSISSIHKLVIMASEIEARLSDLPGKILPEKQNVSLIDSICDTSDELSIVFEKTMNGLEEAAHEIDIASRLGSSFEKEISSGHEKSGQVVSLINEAIAKTEEAKAACDEFIGSINKSTAEFGEVIDKFNHLKKKSEAEAVSSEKINSILESITNLIFHLETMAGKMEIFALISQTEILKLSDVKTGFANIPVELGNVIKDLNDLSSGLSEFRRKIRDCLPSLSTREKYGRTDSLIFKTEIVRDSIQELSAMDYSPAENILLLLKLLEDLKKTQAIASEKIGYNEAQIHSVSQNIEQSFGFAGNIKKSLENSLSYTADISSTAMEFYPDEK